MENEVLEDVGEVEAKALVDQAREKIKAEKAGETPPNNDLERKSPETVAAIDPDEAIERDAEPKFGTTPILHEGTKRTLAKDWMLTRMVKGVCGFGWKDAGLEREYNRLVKATMEIEDDTLGGFIVPEEWRQEQITPLLKEESAFRAAGATVISDAPPVLYMMRQTGASAFTFVGMGARDSAISTTNPTLAMDAWRLRRAVGAVALDEGWLKFAVSGAERFVIDDIVSQWAETEDTVYWGGAGGAEPSGMRYDPLYADGGTYTTNVNGTIASSHLLTLRTTFRARKVRKPDAILMSPTTWGYVIDEKSGIDTHTLISDMTKAPEEAVLGYKIHQSSLFDDNEILAGNFKDFVITEQPLEIRVLKETKAMELQVIIRAVTYIDGKPRRPRSFQRLYGITG